MSVNFLPYSVLHPSTPPTERKILSFNYSEVFN